MCEESLHFESVYLVRMNPSAGPMVVKPKELLGPPRQVWIVPCASPRAL